MESEDLEVQQIADNTLEKRRLTEEELTTVQRRNQRPYNRRFRHRRLRFGDSVFVWAPTGQNRQTFAWIGPYKIVGRLGNDEYRVEISPGKVETYHVNFLKKYHCGQRLSCFHEGQQMNNSPQIFC